MEARARALWIIRGEKSSDGGRQALSPFSPQPHPHLTFKTGDATDQVHIRIHTMLVGAGWTLGEARGRQVRTDAAGVPNAEPGMRGCG